MSENRSLSKKKESSFLLQSLKDIWTDLAPFENATLLHTNIGKDIMSGVVIAVIALPLALAFGVGSGLGAVAGLWGAVAGGIVGGFFGGSRISVSGPTGPTMVQLASVMVAFRLSSGELDFSAAFTIVFLSGLISEIFPVSCLLSEELTKKIKVLKPEGPLFFGSIETLECSYESDDSHDDLIVDLTRVPMMDLSGAYALEDLILKAKGKGKEVFICNANERVSEISEKTEIVKHIGDEYFLSLTEDAVIQAQELELVKSTYHQMAKRSVGNMDSHCDRTHFTKAAAYAHDAVYNQELRSHYGKGSPSEILARAVEDYLVVPEITDIEAKNDSNQSERVIECRVKDNYRVTEVSFSILDSEGKELERGIGSCSSAGDSWEYHIQTAIDALSELALKVEVTDRPGNTTSKQVLLSPLYQNFV